MNMPGLAERITRPARSLRLIQLVEMLFERVEHVPREHVRARLRVVEREHGDVGFGKRQRKRGGGRHADQDTADWPGMSGPLTEGGRFRYNGWRTWLKPRAKTTMPAPEKSDSCSTCGAGWRLPLLLGIVLAAILLGSSDRIRQSVFKPLREAANR